MRVLCVLVALIGLAACAAAPPKMTREQYIAELVRTAGIEDVLSHAQAQSAAEAHRLIDRTMSQFGDLLAKLPAERRQMLTAAVDRFMAAATAPLDTADAAAAWGRFYAAKLSDEELRQALKYARTPLGRKQLQAGASAADQLRTYLQEKRAPIMEKAAAQYVADLRAIVTASKETAAPAGKPNP